MSREFSVEDLQTLMKGVAENKLGELLFENETFKLRIRSKRVKQTVHQTINNQDSAGIDVATEEHPACVGTENRVLHPDITTIPAGEGKCVTSPLVGTFYASGAPDKPPFVRAGQRVRKGDVLFIVESMKVMNEVLAEQEGVVAEVMVDSGQPVEYGQPVLRLE